MLQVWKIVVPSGGEHLSPALGWALASTSDEVLQLSGMPKSIVSPDPERLWIAKERIVWEIPPAKA